MMKLKKLFALALAGVMTLALLTGCGDKPGDKPADTPPCRGSGRHHKCAV